MRIYSVIIREEHHQTACDHLLQDPYQEDLCFATYTLSTGANRTTAIISGIILPLPGERNVHGNVGLLPAYFERALQTAMTRKEGLMLMHSHMTNGWQNMSEDDINTESSVAPSVQGGTGLPFVGMTIGRDGAWSARFWLKDILKKRQYNRHWCQTVRKIGKKLSITFNENLLAPAFDRDKQLRTISAWGTNTQEDISRLHIGIVGLGSVGSIVAEILARTGISHFTLIDFDSVETKNLDRLTGVFKEDVGQAKINVVREAIRRSASAPHITIDTCEYSICERQGFEQALNCDIIFSCVDRPWPRQVLNFIAYAHLIPVIDGGILVRTNKENTFLKGADWKAHTVGYKRVCLECIGQYKAENAELEMRGKLDDPEYIKGLDPAVFREAHENVYAFSSHLASLEVLQMLALFIAPGGVADQGQQIYHFVIGNMDAKHNDTCHECCLFQEIIGKGDSTGITVYAEHHVAMCLRQTRTAKELQTQALLQRESIWEVAINKWKRFKSWVITPFKKS